MTFALPLACFLPMDFLAAVFAATAEGFALIATARTSARVLAMGLAEAEDFDRIEEAGMADMGIRYHPATVEGMAHPIGCMSH